MAKRRKDAIAAAFSIYLCCCIAYCTSHANSWRSIEEFSSETHSDKNDGPVFQHRKLLNISDSNSSHLPQNCSPPAIEQFPRPLLNYSTRRQGALVLHVLVSLYMLFGLALVCDGYFVPSLEKMCEVFNMQPDVAGATFMAAGSSAPELATAVIAVFIAKDDIGIGTVVGSAVYNITFVIAICGLFAGRAVFLNWWPMFRDCVFYLISILALLFALRDELVTWVESVLFLSLYCLYILFMIVNRRVENWVCKFRFVKRFQHQAPNTFCTNSYKPVPDSVVTLTSENGSKIVETEMVPPSPPSDDEEEPLSFNPPSGAGHRMMWFFSLPFMGVFYITIPDYRKPRWEGWCFATFLLSCVWISLFSYILVWMITIIGFTLHIKDTVMGLTFLAAGVSVPDAIASLLVVREGHGDMAVSNAVGSNVFDILLCLGLPWFLQTVVVDPGSSIPVSSKGLTYSTLSLLVTVIFLLVATHLNHWQLDRRYGVILLAWYSVFMVMSTLYELDIFGVVSLPTCLSDF